MKKIGKFMLNSTFNSTEWGSYFYCFIKFVDLKSGMVGLFYMIISLNC